MSYVRNSTYKLCYVYYILLSLSFNNEYDFNSAMDVCFKTLCLCNKKSAYAREIKSIRQNV